jgi:hypothetical protein
MRSSLVKKWTKKNHPEGLDPVGSEIQGMHLSVLRLGQKHFTLIAEQSSGVILLTELQELKSKGIPFAKHHSTFGKVTKASKDKFPTVVVEFLEVSENEASDWMNSPAVWLALQEVHAVVLTLRPYEVDSLELVNTWRSVIQTLDQNFSPVLVVSVKGGRKLSSPAIVSSSDLDKICAEWTAASSLTFRSLKLEADSGRSILNVLGEILVSSIKTCVQQSLNSQPEVFSDAPDPARAGSFFEAHKKSSNAVFTHKLESVFVVREEIDPSSKIDLVADLREEIRPVLEKFPWTEILLKFDTECESLINNFDTFPESLFHQRLAYWRSVKKTVT